MLFPALESFCGLFQVIMKFVFTVLFVGAEIDRRINCR